MTRRRILARGCLGAVVLLALASGAAAGTFTITPLRVDFAGGARTAAA